jgi:hypothetical protein
MSLASIVVRRECSLRLTFAEQRVCGGRGDLLATPDVDYDEVSVVMLLLSGDTQKSQKVGNTEVVLFKAAAMKDIRSIHTTSYVCSTATCCFNLGPHRQSSSSSMVVNLSMKGELP